LYERTLLKKKIIQGQLRKVERVGQEAKGSIPACSLPREEKPTRGKEEVMADTKRRGR